MNKSRLRLRLVVSLMKKLDRIFLILTLTYFSLVSPSFAQIPAQMPTQIPAQMPDELSEEQMQPVMNIEVKDGLLSVELSDAEFGKVIKEIAERANFKVEISSDVAYKKIGTNFKDVEVAKGIRRLLTLIREQDYTLSYNPSGGIDKIEIYGGSGGSPSKPISPAGGPISPAQKRPTTTHRQVTPVMPRQQPQFKDMPPPVPEMPIEEINE